jgi:meiosis-specific APC/C activator protein AMA1
VGGIAPSEPAVNNGRGQLVQRGTSARLFRTFFPPIYANPDDELDRHEARLAMALDLDRAQRVLQFNVPESSNTRPVGKLEATSSRLKTFWDGSRWVKQGPVPSKYGQCLTPGVSLTQTEPSETRRLPITAFRCVSPARVIDILVCSHPPEFLTPRT